MVASVGRVERVAISLETRGFGGSTPRTSRRVVAFGPAERALLADNPVVAGGFPRAREAGGSDADDRDLASVHVHGLADEQLLGSPDPLASETGEVEGAVRNGRQDDRHARVCGLPGGLRPGPALAGCPHAARSRG